MAKPTSVPRPVPDPMLLLRGRSGIDGVGKMRGATGYDLAEVLVP